MEDEGGVLLDGKALGNLRVVDLKQELEKRGLSKSGSKKDLVKRLKQQLEFEKLCGERKSTDCDLKLELDADTEQNEFVQQYLAQQQKIYAEQKEVKRRIELEEIQKSGDERGSDSPRAGDASDHDARYTSGNESAPEAFENVQAVSNIPRIEKQIDDDSSKENTDDLKQKEVEAKDIDSEEIDDPIKGGSEKQITEDKIAISEIKDEEVSNLSGNYKDKAMIKESKLEIIATKSPNQIKSSVNIDIDDHKVEKAESEDCIAGGFSEHPSNKGETKSYVENLDNIKVEQNTNVSDTLDSHVQLEKKDENQMDEELKSEGSTIHSSENFKTNPVQKAEDSSKEPTLKNEDVSQQPSCEKDSSVQPNLSSVTDKLLEKSLDVAMEPAAEVSPVPYALSENKENVMKPVPKPVHEENMSDKKKNSKKDSHAKGTDSDSESQSPASEKELSEQEEAKNLNGKSSHKQLIKGSGQETDNPVKESKLKRSPENDSSPDKMVKKSQLKSKTSEDKTKTKSRNYAGESEEGEMKSESESESGNSSDSSEHSRSRQKSRKVKRKVSQSGSSDSSRSRSRGSSSDQKVVKKDEKESYKDDTGSHDDLSREEKFKIKTKGYKQGKLDSRERKKSPSRSRSSSSRSQSRDSSIEKIDRTDGEKNVKVNAVSVSKNHGDSVQEKSKSGKSGGSQNIKVQRRKAKRNKSSSSSRSRSRDSSVEKEESEKNSKLDPGSLSESHDRDEHQESKPLPSDGKRDRQDSKKGKRKISRSGSSSSSRSRSRESSSAEKVEKMDTEESSNAGPVPKNLDKSVEKDKHKPETPQKKFKIKRDNVVVFDSPQALKKDENEEKLQIRKNSDAEVDETVEKSTVEVTKEIEIQPPTKYVSTRKIRISGRKLSEKSEEEPKVKRGKWGSYSSSQKPSQAISISTDSLKNWFPDFKLLKNPDVLSEAIEEIPSKEEINPDHLTEKTDESKQISQIVEMKDEQAPELVEQKDESEATNILFIQNLVRPFTLLQLKELLKETGNFIEEKFWIDKIKSKCFVTYSTVEDAIKTKTALNGTRWPSSNPKILNVEYSTEEDLQLHQSGSDLLPKSLPPPPPAENPEPLESFEDLRRKERETQERRRERSKPQPVREWDKNKLTQESPTRERISRSIERSSDKKEKKDTKRRPNEDTPAKLLDDLFQKTKSSPCIYWLPLTEEQVVEREEARRLRRLEREKRLQQREQEAEHKAKAAQSRNRTREMQENRRSSTRSRSPVSRRR